MSHTSTLKTNITDLEALRRALLQCGIKANQIEISDSPLTAHGYHGEAFHANLVVHKAKDGMGRDMFGSDIGWEKTRDGTYAVHIDGYNYGTHQHYDESWTNRLNTRYAVEKSKMALDAGGIEYTETVDEKKRTVIKARFKSAEQSRFVRMGR